MITDHAVYTVLVQEGSVITLLSGLAPAFAVLIVVAVVLLTHRWVGIWRTRTACVLAGTAGVVAALFVPVTLGIVQLGILLFVGIFAATLHERPKLRRSLRFGPITLLAIAIAGAGLLGRSLWTTDDRGPQTWLPRLFLGRIENGLVRNTLVSAPRHDSLGRSYVQERSVLVISTDVDFTTIAYGYPLRIEYIRNDYIRGRRLCRLHVTRWQMRPIDIILGSQDDGIEFCGESQWHSAEPP
jgi:hypothetical protein